MSDEDKVAANITIGIDLFSEKGVVLIPGGAAQWKRVVHKSMPEYNFGNDGCWVNRHGMLEYVPEENFTQDILEALEDKHVNLVYLRRIFRTFLSDIPSQIVKHTMMPDKSQDKPIIKLKQNANELSRL